MTAFPGSLGLGRRALGVAAAGTLLAAPAGRKAAAARLPESAARPLPDIGFTDADGTPRTPADFRGRGLLINLWATWCPPCVAEMPALDRAQAALAGEGILILPLSSDRGGRAVVEPFYQQRGIRHLRIWLDARGAASRALGARGLPTTIIVDRQGQERARLEGDAPWDDAGILADIRRLVGPAAPPAVPPAAAPTRI